MLNDDFWSVYARVYDLGTTTLHPYRVLQGQVLERLRVPGSGHVVDAGCGTLSYGDRIARRFPSLLVTGLENSSGMLEVAERKVQDRRNIAVRQHDFNSNGWPSDCKGVDAVLSINMLYALQNPKEFLRQAFDALKPGGQLLLVNLAVPDLRLVLGEHYLWRMMNASPQELAEDDAVNWARRVVTVLNEEIAKASRGNKLHVYNAVELAALVRAAGFTIHQETGVVPDAYAGTTVLIDATR